MDKNIYKNIVYYYWFRISDKTQLLKILNNELNLQWTTKNIEETEKMTYDLICKYMNLISWFTISEFNFFVKELLDFIKSNFKWDDYYFLVSTVINDFFVAHDFMKKFNNKYLIEILIELYNEIIKNAEWDFVKSHSANWLDAIINSLKK